MLIEQRVLRRFLARDGQYFQLDDVVLYGKYKNHRGKIVSFGKDKWGNPTVEVEPIPKGRKQNKVFGLFKIWRADVKEKALAEQEKAKAEMTARVLSRFAAQVYGSLMPIWRKFFEDLFVENATKIRQQISISMEYYAKNNEKLDVEAFLRGHAGEMLDVATSNISQIRKEVQGIAEDIFKYVNVFFYEGDEPIIEFDGKGMIVRDLRPEGSYYDMDVEVPEEAETGERMIQDALQRSGATNINILWGFKRHPDYRDQKTLGFRIGFTIPLKGEDFLPLLQKSFSDDVEREGKKIPAEDWGENLRFRQQAPEPSKPVRKPRKR